METNTSDNLKYCTTKDLGSNKTYNPLLGPPASALVSGDKSSKLREVLVIAGVGSKRCAAN